MFLIFSPLFYINGDPHIGHRFSIEIINCMQRLINITGLASIKYSGTDEHGDKIIKKVDQLKQKDSDLNYEKFLSIMRKSFNDIYKGFNVYNTHENYHKTYVRSIFEYLKKQNIIYEGTYKGYYCITEERYLTQQEVTQDKIDSGGISLREEKGLFLKIDKDISKQIIDFIPNIILTKQYHQEAINILKNSDQDIFITRRIKHEAMISIDDYEDLSFYVWFDAINYYNNIVSMHAVYNIDCLIVIGCDIMRFHLIMLLHISYYIYNGLIPYRFMVHGMITIDKIKISKSFNNFEDANLLYDKYGSMLYASIISESIAGEIMVSEVKCNSYISFVKNNIRNFYNRLVNLFPIYNKYGKFSVNILSLNINSPNISKLLKVLKQINIVSRNSMDISQVYIALNEISDMANNTINKYKLWDADKNKIVILYECKVFMFYMIILEYVLGHDVDNIISKTNINIFGSIFRLYDTKFDIDKLIPDDFLIKN